MEAQPVLAREVVVLSGWVFGQPPFGNLAEKDRRGRALFETQALTLYLAFNFSEDSLGFAAALHLDPMLPRVTHGVPKLQHPPLLAIVASSENGAHGFSPIAFLLQQLRAASRYSWVMPGSS